MDKKELKFEILNDLGTISESTKGWSKKTYSYYLEWRWTKIWYQSLEFWIKKNGKRNYSNRKRIETIKRINW